MTAVPNNPGCWTLPIPTSIVMPPFAFSRPFHLQGHAAAPAEHFLQLCAEGLD